VPLDWEAATARPVVKVGKSSNPKARCAQLQGGNARELIVRWTTEPLTLGEASALEYTVKRWLDEDHIRGENFACSAETARHAIERWLYSQRHPLSADEEWASTWSLGPRPKIPTSPRHLSQAAFRAHATRKLNPTP